MKTTILILSIMIGTLGTYILRLDGRIFQNSNCHQRITHVKSDLTKDNAPWNSKLLVKVDSSNNYIFIIGKKSISDKDQHLSENLFIKSHCNIRNVDKKVTDQPTGILNEGYLDIKFMNRNNISRS